MKKLRKISLEGFDRLTSSETSKLIGGNGTGNPTIPPPSNTIPIHGGSTKPPHQVGNILGGNGVVSGSGAGIRWTFSL